jgi:hypothetical protein
MAQYARDGYRQKVALWRGHPDTPQDDTMMNMEVIRLFMTHWISKGIPRAMIVRDLHRSLFSLDGLHQEYSRLPPPRPADERETRSIRARMAEVSRVPIRAKLVDTWDH